MSDEAPLAGRRRLGRTDLQVAELCLGGNVFGWTADESDSFDVLDRYAGAGGNFIDTADAYSAWKPGNSGGESERILGDWMASRGNRDAMIIATKVGKLPGAAGLAAGNIRRAADDSLARLRTDRIDVYYAHLDDHAVPLEESLAAFDGLVREGKVRYVAASNFSAERLSAALDISASAGMASFVALQNHYNLVERAGYEDTVRAVVVAHQLGSLPFYGLARGFLTGKYREGRVVDSPRAEGVAQYVNARGERVLSALESCAKRLGTTAAAIALAWLLAQPTVTCPIASARNTEQLDELLAMTSVTLSPEDLASLDQASA
jgi:aryl-alcohol dehydrogenase-like predicted oxidoreductase